MAIEGVRGNGNECTNGINGYAGSVNGANVTTNGSTTRISDTAGPTEPPMPIAICGMGLRLPGGVRNDSDLYDFLVNKKDARSLVPKDRYDIDSFYSPYAKPGTIITKHGYFLEDVDFSKFDLSMFNMTPAETERLDPHQRILLEVVREAFESAGEADFRGKKIGTYVGSFTDDWLELFGKDVIDCAPYQLHGKMDFALGNRVAYEYDLRGPSMTIKTACSSSALGIHEALYSIRSGECSAAIVAGSNLNLAPGLWVGMSAQMTLAPDGSSKTFDALADGYARGDGVAALYVKRLDKAIRDGNPVRAIIRSSSSNADGRTPGMTMPSTDAQEALIRRCYEAAGLDVSGTAMVECHGTGTAVGDPMEVAAVARCFGEKGVYIGSVKPNLGHGEGASAITSVAKAVLALENKTILPNIKFNTPNPAIPWELAKLKVPTEPLPWPADRLERISVNSFGIGGSNVHFILDSAASFGLSASKGIPRRPSYPPRKHLLLFSANHTEALAKLAENYKNYLEKHPGDLESMAYTLAERREHLKLRTFCVTDGSAPFEVAANAKVQATSQVAFVFTGQGAQWVHMGRELMRDFPPFMDSIRSADEVLQSVEHAPSWTIEAILAESEDKTLISKTEFSQPICTALQVALIDLLATWDIKPSAVVGHSSGEIAAAYAAGALTKKEAIIVAFYRGYVCAQSRVAGGMAAIGLGRDEVIPYLVPGVRVACENSGSSVTLSGDLDRLEDIMAAIQRDVPNALVRRLQVETAYHSHHMQAVGDSYRDLIDKHLTPKPARVPFFSSVNAKVLREAAAFGPQYWQDNLESPVLFHSAVTRLLAESDQTFIHLEVGPHSALAGPLRQIYKETGSTIQYASVLTRGKNDTQSFLESVGQLYCGGVKIHFPTPEDAKVLTDLPTYPWHYEASYWAETRVMSNWRFRKHLPHDLLGLRTLESNDVDPTWRNNLRIVDVPWLRDHCVGNDIVFPAAAYMAMAGEAVFQITGSRDYTLRDVEFSTAMVLRESKSAEIMTTLRKKRLTSTLDSNWYEFSIVSHDGTAWNRHCSGLIINGRASTAPAPKVNVYVKDVSSKRWYQTMSRVGLNYGSRFIGLEDITASSAEKKAAMSIMDRQVESESSYALHPTTLDLILQSWTVASVKGEHRLFTKLFLPTFIEEFYVRPAMSKMIKVNTVAIGPSGTARGESYGVANGEVVYFLKGFKGAPLNQQGMEKPAEQKALHLQWKPDFTFTDATKLMRPSYDSTFQLRMLERMFVLCAIEARKKLVDVKASQPHFEKYRLWIHNQVERFLQPNYPLVEDSADLVNLDEESRGRMILECLEQSKTTTAWPVATAIWRAYDRLTDVFEGQIEYLALLFQDGLMPKFYDWSNDLSDVGGLFQLLAHSKPQLRVLEIGAGTGGATAKTLEKLKSDFGERLYLKYTISDISSGFFVQCKERFKEHEAIEYKVLDISKDPIGQGFNVGEYDLIIASNVLHATPSLTETLKHCRTLLKSDGLLFLQELSPVQKYMGFIMGLFSGWWLGEEDGRTESPLVPPDVWDTKLRDAGFEGVDAVSFDNKLPYYMSANMTARPAVAIKYPERVTLLTHTSNLSLLAQTTERLLREAGYEIDQCIWGQRPPGDQDLISFVDVDSSKPLLKDVSEEDLSHFLQIVDDLSQAVLVWLTPQAQINCQDPHAAQILGMARTLRAELAMDFATIELEDTSAENADGIVKVLRKIQRSRVETDDLDPDLEYAFADGTIHLGRFHWFPVSEALAETAPPPDAKSLIAGQRGMLQTLKWTGHQFDPLGANEVQVKMTTVGMNFHDLMIIMNMFDSPIALGKGYNSIGMEGTGYVTKTGSGVTNVKTGDRVVVVGSNSTGFATEIQRPAEFCIHCPERLSDEEAAGMPFAYMTVLWCFLDKANLRKGQTVLIHSAAGGVGIAAIHVARWIGAEIYVTVGNEEKVSFLMKQFNIPRDHIFDSHDVSFLDGIMAATDGVGVDAVLNSVSGELLHASWKCVAANGCMLEIGKRDLINRGQLALNLFEENRSYFGVDFSRLTIVNKPAVVRLLAQTMDLFKQGHIQPIHPTTVFDAEKAEDAFRYMQKGMHIGRIIIRFPKDDVLPLTPSVPPPSFKSDVSYLLVGGMGGLGRSVASWMVSAGAKHLIFLSRSAGKSEADHAFIRGLNEAGCTVQCQVGDVTDSDIVRKVVEQAPKPVAGVMQMAMVLRDVGVRNMDQTSWSAAIRPKVQGTWNLHDHLPKDLDFFILFGSNSGTLGSYGQANYAAANAFLDAFVHYRRNLGLRASVMDIGAVGDVGYVSRTQGAAETMVTMAGRLITEQDFLNCLQLCIARSSETYLAARPSTLVEGYYNPRQVVLFNHSILPMTDPQNAIFWKRDPRMAIYRNIQKTTSDGGGAENDNLRRFLTSLMSDPGKLDQRSTSKLVAEEIARQVSTFLMRGDDGIDVSRTLTDVGVDSLVAIEVRNWWKQSFGVEVSVLELRDGGSIQRLAELAVQRLKEKYTRE